MVSNTKRKAPQITKSTNNQINKKPNQQKITTLPQQNIPRFFRRMAICLDRDKKWGVW